MSTFDSKRGAAFVAEKWQESILETLSEYIRVPNQSPMFDSEVLTNGYQDEAVKIIMDWITSQNVPNLTMRLETCEGRTPVIYAEVPSTIEGSTETILMYGHLDKQPPMLQGWEEGTGPYTPVVKDGKLYGRGGADDGYSAFAAITALKSVQEQGLQHARIVLLVEACEESGSKDLPYYIEKLKDDIGNPSLVVCLDSGCGNYDQLWMTATLRGMIFGILRVDVTQEGVHSGDASGTIPSSFRIMRDLLDRIEVSKTGELLPKSLHVEIPEKHYQYAKDAAETLDSAIVDDFPLLDNMSPVNDNYLECLLNKTWRPTLSYTGIDKIPHIKQAGNVLRPTTALGLSFRLPPTCEPEQAYLELKSILESNPPYGAKVSFESNKYSQGWIAPEMQPWLEEAVQKASQESFGKPALVWGEGFSIPFMDMLGKMFPETQFVITGVLGPKSNAHGPNEFMHIEMFHNITNSIASIIHSHYEAKVKV